MKHLEIKQIRYFCAAALTLSLNRAARDIGITQPALTRQIQLFEDDIGLELFRRKSTGLELTPHGEAFLKRAQNFVNRYTKGIMSPTAMHRILHGEIILGSESDLFATWPSFAESLKTFRGQFPEYDVTLAEVDRDGIECLHAKKIDVLVSMRRQNFSDDVVEQISVGDSTASIVVHRSHPLAEKESVTMRDLEQQPLMLLNEEAYHGHIDDITSICSAQNIKLKITHTASNPQTLLSFADAEAGILLTVGNLFDFKNTSLVKIPVSDLRVTVPRMLSILARRGDENPAIRAFLDSFNS